MSGLLRLLARHRRAVILTVALVLSFLLMTLQVRHEAAVVTFTLNVLLTGTTVYVIDRLWRMHVRG